MWGELRRSGGGHYGTQKGTYLAGSQLFHGGERGHGRAGVAGGGGGGAGGHGGVGGVVALLQEVGQEVSAAGVAVALVGRAQARGRGRAGGSGQPLELTGALESEKSHTYSSEPGPGETW